MGNVRVQKFLGPHEINPFPSRSRSHFPMTRPPGTPERASVASVASGWRTSLPCPPGPGWLRGPSLSPGMAAQPLPGPLSSEAALCPHQRLAVLGHRSPLSSEPTRPYLYFGLWQDRSPKRIPSKPQISLQSARASCAAARFAARGRHPFRPRRPTCRSRLQAPKVKGGSRHTLASPIIPEPRRPASGPRSGAIFLKALPASQWVTRP